MIIPVPLPPHPGKKETGHHHHFQYSALTLTLLDLYTKNYLIMYLISQQENQIFGSVIKDERKQSCLKLQEMARKLIENVY